MGGTSRMIDMMGIEQGFWLILVRKRDDEWLAVWGLYAGLLRGGVGGMIDVEDSVAATQGNVPPPFFVSIFTLSLFSFGKKLTRHGLLLLLGPHIGWDASLLTRI